MGADFRHYEAKNVVTPLSFFPTLTTVGARMSRRLFPSLNWRMPDTDRTVYLTFDDGPTRLGTPRLLELLDQFEAPSTFFLVGRNTLEHPEMAREIVHAGHTVGQHTFSHPNAWQIRSGEIEFDLERGTKVVEEVTGTIVTCMRPPYGRITQTLIRWCSTHDQRVVMWDVMPGDYIKGISSRAVEKHVLRYVRPGSIIVLHDNEKVIRKTPMALSRILRSLSAEGWKFAAL